jgi:hypothetical protein
MDLQCTSDSRFSLDLSSRVDIIYIIYWLPPNLSSSNGNEVEEKDPESGCSNFDEIPQDPEGEGALELEVELLGGFSRLPVGGVIDWLVGGEGGVEYHTH